MRAQRSDGVEHGGENCEACREVKNGRDSEPEQMHAELKSKALGLSIL